MPVAASCNQHPVFILFLNPYYMRIAKVIATITIAGQDSILRMFFPVDTVFAGRMHHRLSRENICIMRCIPCMPGVTNLNDGTCTQQKFWIVDIVNVRDNLRMILVAI
ncbi:hypothetical protein D3C72_1869640 [compost metagenome]